MIRKVFLDVETTGLRPDIHDVIEIGGLMTIGDEVVTDKFLLTCQPRSYNNISPEALEVNHYTVDKLKELDDPDKVHADFVRLLERHVSRYDPQSKYFFYAWNAPFDEAFIRAFLGKAGNKYFGSWFFHPSIDIRVLAGEHFLKERHDMTAFHLNTVARKLGILIKEDKLHNASHDAELAYKIYRAL